MILVLKHNNKFYLAGSAASCAYYAVMNPDDIISEENFPIYKLPGNSGAFIAFDNNGIESNLLRYNKVFDKLTYLDIVHSLGKIDNLLEEYYPNGYERENFILCNGKKAFHVVNNCVYELKDSFAFGGEERTYPFINTILQKHMAKGEELINLAAEVFKEECKLLNHSAFPLVIVDCLTGERKIIKKEEDIK